MDLPMQIPSNSYFTALTRLQVETEAQTWVHLFLILGKSRPEPNISTGNWTWLSPYLNAVWKDSRDSSACLISHKYPKMPPKFFRHCFHSFRVLLKLKQKASVCVRVYDLELCALCAVRLENLPCYYDFINVFIFTPVLQFILLSSNINWIS